MSGPTKKLIGVIVVVFVARGKRITTLVVWVVWLVRVVRIIGVVRMVGVVRIVQVVRMAGVVMVVGMVWVVRVVGVVMMVTLLAEHYFVQISVGWWSLLLVMGFMGLCVSCPTTTIHESLVNRLTYGCKPVKNH